MRHITITIEHLPENVYLATSEDLPGFTVESADRDEIFKLSQTLALEFLRLDEEVSAEEKVMIDFAVQE